MNKNYEIELYGCGAYFTGYRWVNKITGEKGKVFSKYENAELSLHLHLTGK